RCASCTPAYVPDDGVIPTAACGPVPSARNSLGRWLSNMFPLLRKHSVLEFVPQSHQSAGDWRSLQCLSSEIAPSAVPRNRSSSSLRKSRVLAHDGLTSNPTKSLPAHDCDAP